MNKVILTLCLFVCLQISSNAEDVLRPKGRIGGTESSGGNGLTGFDGVSPISFGIEGGANLNFYGSNMSVNDAYVTKINAALYPYYYYEVNDLIYIDESGFGVSPHIGLFMDVPINDKSGIGLRLSYDSRSFGNKRDGQSQVTDANGVVQMDMPKIPFTLEYKNTYDYFGINLNYRYNFTKEFFMTFGINFDLLMSDKSETTYTSDDPNYPLYFTAIGRGVATNPYQMSGSSTLENNPRVNSSRIGLDIGANYKIKLSRTIALVPYARFQFFITEPFTDFTAEVPTSTTINGITYNFQQMTGETWSNKQTDAYLHTLQLGLSLWFNF